MNFFDATRLMELQAQVSASQAAMGLAREHLIERLGDHMCGSLEGRLTRAELKVMARARRSAALTKRGLALFLTHSTLKTLTRSTTAHAPQMPVSRYDPKSRT